MNAGINTKPPIGLLRFTPQKKRETEDIPIGTRVRTPLGLVAVVIGYSGVLPRSDKGYKGGPRDHRARLVCRYERRGGGKSGNIVRLTPDLVEVIRG